MEPETATETPNETATETPEVVAPVAKAETPKARVKRVVSAPIDALDEMTGELTRAIPATFSGAVQVNY